MLTGAAACPGDDWEPDGDAASAGEGTDASRSRLDLQDRGNKGILCYKDQIRAKGLLWLQLQSVRMLMPPGQELQHRGAAFVGDRWSVRHATLSGSAPAHRQALADYALRIMGRTTQHTLAMQLARSHVRLWGSFGCKASTAASATCKLS